MIQRFSGDGSIRMRILVVDDTEAVLLLITRFVQTLGHTALQARNGEEAVTIWRREQPEMILMDMMMPIMSGTEAAESIKAEAGENWVPIVLITAVGEETALAEAIERGADDYLNKPVNFRVLEAKLKAINRTLDLNRKVREQSHRLGLYYDQAEEEKLVVRHLMDQMVNAERLSDSQLQYWLLPAEGLSGDLIAAARTPGGVLHVMLADGIGHGLTAALNVLPLTQPFYSMTEKGFGLADILVEMNNKVRQVLPTGRFVAVALLAINDLDGVVEVWNSGMPPVTIFSSSGQPVHLSKSTSVPLGILPNTAIDFSLDRYCFNGPGVILAHSDGLTEARNDQCEQFGSERIQQAFAAEVDCNQWLPALQDSLTSFLNGVPHHDDVSLVLVRFGQELVAEVSTVRRPPLALRQLRIADVQAQGQSLWRYDVKLGVAELRTIRVVPFLMSYIRELSLSKEQRADVYQILSVLFSQALDYSLLCLPHIGGDGVDMVRYEQERQRRLQALPAGSIEITLEAIQYHAALILLLRVADSGEGVDWAALLAEQPGLAGYLRGLPLVRELCTDLQFSALGNEALACYVISER